METRPVDLGKAQHHKIEAHAHAVPFRTLLMTFVALMVLTVLTVASHEVDFGPANIWIALVIAFLKATIVALYFMHLRWDSKFNTIVLVASLLFVTLFLGVALIDSREYQRNYDLPTVGAPTQ
jgi:cytochrome c oxidase subunit 4